MRPHAVALPLLALSAAVLGDAAAAAPRGPAAHPLSRTFRQLQVVAPVELNKLLS
jgi:hypothetical protein